MRDVLVGVAGRSCSRARVGAVWLRRRRRTAVALHPLAQRSRRDRQASGLPCQRRRRCARPWTARPRPRRSPRRCTRRYRLRGRPLRRAPLTPSQRLSARSLARLGARPRPRPAPLARALTLARCPARVSRATTRWRRAWPTRRVRGADHGARAGGRVDPRARSRMGTCVVDRRRSVIAQSACSRRGQRCDAPPAERPGAASPAGPRQRLDDAFAFLWLDRRAFGARRGEAWSVSVPWGRGSFDGLSREDTLPRWEAPSSTVCCATTRGTGSRWCSALELRGLDGGPRRRTTASTVASIITGVRTTSCAKAGIVAVGPVLGSVFVRVRRVPGRATLLDEAPRTSRSAGRWGRPSPCATPSARSRGRRAGRGGRAGASGTPFHRANDAGPSRRCTRASTWASRGACNSHAPASEAAARTARPKHRGGRP